MGWDFLREEGVILLRGSVISAVGFFFEGRWLVLILIGEEGGLGWIMGFDF